MIVHIYTKVSNNTIFKNKLNTLVFMQKPPIVYFILENGKVLGVAFLEIKNHIVTN
ncbi:hypothetical protein BTHERMOSOX_155 [Bathymodiolus thermophilus thioautotrophic gill symbiont]|uniref:Uncharacterized protein n=1 Tax=Bathymodiolus thermophilus thioautotrophic gill symbiont TaxID=2360 RepID=A0A8H9CGJ1_9GAMM|nr:hypothetical protein THERMOS_1991 [Bathymodiolus thermophilus thioautotrophic gill symbiont]SGZ78495.1 hypothetical protein BTHERMOSOX_155 [Bathymodiolus thermophilus thioautotrophic gill symbiont]